MPTLEERLASLERLASDMRSEHISDIQQLYEHISVLQQQLAEQKKRLADHEQGTERKFDSLVTVLMQQFKNIDTHFVKLDQHMEKLDQQATRTEQWMVAIKNGLDETRLYATMTHGIVEKQDTDIRVIKEDVSDIKERLGRLEVKSDEHTERLGRLETKSDEHTTILNQHTARFDRMDGKVNQIDSKIDQILARLPEKP